MLIIALLSACTVGRGVRVDVDGGLTSIDAEEFSSRSGRFENDAYGASDAVIEIRVEAGVGQVNLILSD